MKGLTFPLYFSREELQIILVSIRYHRMRVGQSVNIAEYNHVEKSVATAIAELDKQGRFGD